jgi:hypothetical protein
MKLLMTGNPKAAAKVAFYRSPQEIKTLTDEFFSSGLSSGIERQRAITTGVKTEAREVPLSTAAKGEGAVSKVIAASDKYGFQAAERLQNVASWLAFRQSKVDKLGRFRLTKTELDEVTAEARHYAYSQTKEAAPSYNSSALAGVMQFAGVIHKGISLTLPQAIGGSKVLSASQKTKLWGFLTATYGVALTDGIDEQLIKIEDKQTRETLRGGLLWTALYNLTGADMSTKNLNPADYAGFLERVRQVASGEWVEASPALGLANKMKKSSEVFMGMFGEVEGGTLELSTGEKAIGALRSLATFFPAASNFWNAKMIEKTQRSSSQYNYTKDDQLTLSEINFKKFGWTTKAEEDSFVIRRIGKASFEEKQADVKQLINNIRAAATIQGLTPEEVAQRISLSNLFWMVYADDTEATEMASREIKNMITQEDKVFSSLANMLGIVDEEQMAGIINIAPVSDDERELLKDMNGKIRNVTGEIK